MTVTECKQIIVPLEFDGARLDLTAAALFSTYSRSRLQQWIKEGALKFEGQIKRPRDKVFAGGLLTLAYIPNDEVGWIPQAIDIEIIEEDDSILIVNKPAGMVVHPSAGHKDGTLVNALLHHSPQLASIPRAGIVHRLDQDTTGLLVIAKSLEAHKSLVYQIQERSIQRQYCAVCIGVMTGGGTINKPIGRHPKHRIKMSVLLEKGKEAITHYRVARRFQHFTQLSVWLETGRTHQIRVHMDHLRYPLLGDKLYGGRQRFVSGASVSLGEAISRFGRQALHSERLTFRHPDTREMVRFKAPLPDDLTNLLAVLDREDGKTWESVDDY